MNQRSVSWWNQGHCYCVRMKTREMCHLFVIWVFFSSFQPETSGSSAPVSKCPHPVSNRKLILCHSGMFVFESWGSPSVSSFSIFFASFFFQSHFSCSLNFLKELLCSKLTVEMWSDLRIFQRKGDCWMINYWHTFLSFASVFWKLLKVCSWSPCFPPFSPSWSCRSPYKETHWWFKW